MSISVDKHYNSHKIVEKILAAAGRSDLDNTKVAATDLYRFD